MNFELELMNYIQNCIVHKELSVKKVISALKYACTSLIATIAEEDRQTATDAGLEISLAISQYLNENYPEETEKTVLSRCIFWDEALSDTRH